MLRPLAKTNVMKLAVIGMGNRVSHMSRLMCEADPDIRIAAAADPVGEQLVRRRMDEWKIPHADETHVFDDAEELLRHAGDFDGLLIGTRCDLHAPMAVRAAATGLPLFLEKPVAISWEQVWALRDAFARREENVVVSFPLRLTVHVQTALQLIRDGRLGVINQVQAVNNVPYGGVYFGQWYRSYETTGGLWLQKATHDFDYINQLLGARPMTIAAMHSRLAYGGNMPPDLVCSQCDRTRTCPESPQNLARRGDDGGTLNGGAPTPQSDHACTFSTNILHQDAGSATVMYDSGAHASYSQNFLSRRSAGFRGATVIGYDATLRFDWQHDRITVIEHHHDRVDEIVVKASGFHGGGDQELAMNFVDVLRGRANSRSGLTDGLLSAAMCLAARQSANRQTFEPIPSVDPVGPTSTGTRPPRRVAQEIEPLISRSDVTTSPQMLR